MQKLEKFYIDCKFHIAYYILLRTILLKEENATIFAFCFTFVMFFRHHMIHLKKIQPLKILKSVNHQKLVKIVSSDKRQSHTEYIFCLVITDSKLILNVKRLSIFLKMWTLNWMFSNEKIKFNTFQKYIVVNRIFSNFLWIYYFLLFTTCIFHTFKCKLKSLARQISFCLNSTFNV